jgi:AraC-like DNA-binding protein
VRRYVHPDTFKMFEREAARHGLHHAAVGAMVRSSYHADQQAHGAARSRRRIDWPALSAWARARWHGALDVAELAAQVHLSPTQFAARCRQETGQSPMQWLRGQRLAHARALRLGGLAVAEAARRTGYRSPSALTAALRREGR